METAAQTDYRWTLRHLEDDTALATLCSELNNLPEALGRVLLLRGVTSLDRAKVWFRGDLEQLHDPFLMAGMDKAVTRILKAVEQNERILVYGDYDVDGTTSTALMTLFLNDHGATVGFFVPNRFVHGYGLSKAGIDYAVEQGTDLIVALDCGVTANEEIDYASEAGIDVVVCDHHEPGDELPNAVAVLDPKRNDCRYPFEGLSGCGVGFKLIQAILQQKNLPAENAWEYLDLVAVSTASDIVPLHDENRFLMRAGLRQLCENPRIGLVKLADKAGVDLSNCSCSSIVFSIGPRINAAGRLEDASLSVRLLLTSDEKEAEQLADEVEAINLRRRELDMQTREEALLLAEKHMESDPKALVLHHTEWHQGVIGITASRVAEQFNRPAVLLSNDGENQVKGSARSVKGFSIYDALSRCSDLLTRFGGHEFAAGLTLPVQNVSPLRERLSAAIESMMSEPDDLVPELELDAMIDLREVLESRFWRVLKQFAPFGPSNPRPVFWARDVKIIGQPAAVGSDKRHLRMRVAQRAGGAPISVIGFGLGDKLETALSAIRRGRPIELAFCVEENTWNGRTSLQLRAKDLRFEIED